MLIPRSAHLKLVASLLMAMDTLKTEIKSPCSDPLLHLRSIVWYKVSSFDGKLKYLMVDSDV